MPYNLEGWLGTQSYAFLNMADLRQLAQSFCRDPTQGTSLSSAILNEIDRIKSVL
jgi:hypothetical protein